MAIASKKYSVDTQFSRPDLGHALKGSKALGRIFLLTPATIDAYNPPRMAEQREGQRMTAPAPKRKDGTLPCEDEVRSLLGAGMKGKDRAMIARAMTETLGRPITPSMLADFTRNGNGKRQPRFPLAWAKPFAMAVGNDTLIRSQLSESSQHALSFGELLLPWVFERAEAELAGITASKLHKDSKRTPR